MSSIFLDPVAMRSTAQVVADQARQAQDAVASLQSTCTADVPAHLTAWLSEELHQIEVQGTTVVVLYTVCALDTALRAQQIAADQSLVSAWTSLTPPTAEVTTPGDLQAALAAGSVVGGYEEPFTTDLQEPTTAIVGGYEEPFTTDLQQPTTAIVGGTPLLEISDVPLMPATGGAGPGSAASLLLGHFWGEGSATVQAPRGTTNIGGGLLMDEQGNRGRLADVYPRPGRDGRYEVRP